MYAYAIVIDELTKRVNVGLGNDYEYFTSQGMVFQEVEEAWNGDWYLKGYAPRKPEQSREEISEKRKTYRQEHIDDMTLERQRKMANGTWTSADEEEYLALDAQVTAWIEENLPYPGEA